MFKVYEVDKEVDGTTEKWYQIFWCPSAPMHYADRIPHDEKVYKHRQAAYRHKKRLEELVEEKH